ncbi:MAG: ribonuclease J, partial [Dehalococcoidia bacterium]
QQIVDAAVKHGRKVGFAGRSMVDNVKMALANGYLKAPSGTILDLQQLNALPLDQQVIIVTGAQGEPTSVLVRIANRSHRDIGIQADDTVIISASTIPGNETLVAGTIDNLNRQGATVVTRRAANVHVQGHASQEELKLMLNLVKPKYFVPIHGEYRMLVAHAALARAVGVPSEHIRVLEDGDILEVDDYGAEVVEHIPAGHIFVDGLRMWDVRSAVLRDRRTLSRDGFVVVVVPLDHATGELVGDPEIVSSGFVDIDEADELLERARAHIAQVLRSTDRKKLEWDYITARVRQELGGLLHKETGRRPMIVPLPIEV